MRALQVMPGKTFVAGATFADIVTLYNFDRELRVLCLDAIERIEVALRASIVNGLAVDRAHTALVVVEILVGVVGEDVARRIVSSVAVKIPAVGRRQTDRFHRRG
jgi:hypothetical protein